MLLINGFTTKYLFTKGILPISVEVQKDCVFGKLTKDHITDVFYEGKNFFRTLEEAKASAEIQKKKKIENLKKQIEKLEKLDF